MAALILFLLVSGIIVWLVWRYVVRWRAKQQFLELYAFPLDVIARVRTRFPQASEQQALEVVEGLRDFFRFFQPNAGLQAIQPSIAVDVAWRAFAEDQAVYDAFCEEMFGARSDVVDCEPMRSPDNVQQGLRLSWTKACSLEDVNPVHPQRLPRLFALDRDLTVENGHFYHVGDGEVDWFDARVIGRHVEVV